MPQLVDAEAYRQVIGHFASGVAVVTARHAGSRYGMTASAISSLSLEPPMLLVCVNRQSPTCAAIAASGFFVVNILGEHQEHLAEWFAKPRPDKFAGIPTAAGSNDVPVLEDALAQLDCRVTNEVVGGTHSVFLATVERADARRGSPLAYFRGRFGRLEVDADGAAAGMSALHDALTGRAALELGAAELSVGRISPDEMKALKQKMEATLPLIRGGRFVDLPRYAAANTEFHEFVVGLAHSQQLVDAYRRLHIAELMGRTLQETDAADDDLVDDHRLLVEAYERGDVELARQVIKNHTAHSLRVHERAFDARST